MKAELKSKIVETLRSGRYEQCVGELYGGGRARCVMGVLAEVAGHRITPYGVQWADGEYNNQALSSSIVDEIGIKDDDYNRLVDMNDSGSTFNEIADWIEENL